MKTVETVKPDRGTFAGCCRFEAFSFGSIRIDGVFEPAFLDRLRGATEAPAEAHDG